MFLVTYAGHERKLADIVDPVGQVAMAEFNRKGIELFRSRGMPEAIREIIKRVATSRRITIMLMAGSSRMRVAVEARNEAMYLIKARNPATSTTRLGEWFDRDHTSVLHSIARHQERHDLPKMVGYDIERVRARNAQISARVRENSRLTL